MRLFNSKLLIACSVFFVFWSCNSNAPQEEESAATEPDSAPVEEITSYIDATEVSPEHYKLLSEEGKVRIIEMTLEPGAKDNLHSHNFESVYFVSGGKVNIYVGEDIVVADIPDGHVMHHEPWNHTVENIGETPIRAILFEQMEKETSPDFEGYIDAVETSPENYELLSEDGNVRVIMMTLEPGQSDTEHSHKSESAYFLSGGKVIIHVGEETIEAEIPDGHVMHHGPWTHYVENVGETAIQAIIFERI